MTPNWRYYFNRWDNSEIEHFVLDTKKSDVITAVDAFDFELENNQRMLSRWERFVWFINLFTSLRKHKREYDILHSHVLLWGGLFMALWAKWNNIPSIYESVLLDSDTPGSIGEQGFGKLKLWLLQQYSGILAISEGIALDYKANGFFEESVHTLVCSIDTDIFRPVVSKEEKRTIREAHCLPQNDIILTFAGSLIYRKGVDLVINAFVEAYKESPNLFLLLVGPKNKNENPSIDEDFLYHVLQKLTPTNLSKNVVLPGLVQNRQNLAEIYRASDIFIFPSRQEGLGIVILEAMATGLPVIVSQLPVLEDIIIDGENGIFVPLDDHDSLTQAILRVSQDSALRERLGRAAFESIQKNNHFSKWQSDLVRIYQGLLLEQKKA